MTSHIPGTANLPHEASLNVVLKKSVGRSSALGTQLNFQSPSSEKKLFDCFLSPFIALSLDSKAKKFVCKGKRFTSLTAQSCHSVKVGCCCAWLHNGLAIAASANSNFVFISLWFEVLRYLVMCTKIRKKNIPCK